VALGVLLWACGAAGAQKLADGSGAFHTGKYRDLFAERGHSAAESKAKIEAAFQQLFHGDKQTQTVYFEPGSNANGPLAYVTDWANKDARTEGMSYGMMIAVQLNKKHEFDAIWNWANTYMLITDAQNPNVGYFAWSMNVDGTPKSDSPAPDGEEYFVMALYFADHRWGSGKGIYDYKAQADRILSLMRHHPVQVGTGPFRLKPEDLPFVPKPRPGMPAGAFNPARKMGSGPMVNEEPPMIRFVPNYVPPAAGATPSEPGAAASPFAGAENTTDASYHLPHFYELWARWGPVEDRTFWARAAEVSRKFFVTVTGLETALTPDRSHFDGSPVMGRNGEPVPFSYDSWRSVSNWSVDYSWFGKNAEARALSDKYQRFLVGQGIHTFADRYTLDGKPLSERHSPGMVATGAVGGLAATKGANETAFVDELWSTPIPSGEQRYYDGMLYIMSLMHCSGNFRIWGPK
jgi:oligosaccharide reducing-end xylanase